MCSKSSFSLLQSWFFFSISPTTVLFRMYVIIIKFDFGYEICSVSDFISPIDEVTISVIKIENRAISRRIKGCFETAHHSNVAIRFLSYINECLTHHFLNEIIVTFR